MICHVKNVTFNNMEESFVISTGQSKKIAEDCIVRIELFSITTENPSCIGQRVTIFADVEQTTKDKRLIHNKVAIASLVVGTDWDQPVDLMFNPSDRASICCEGADVEIQCIFTSHNCSN